MAREMAVLSWVLVLVGIFASCYTKTIDISLKDANTKELKDVETVAKEEEQRLKDLHENPEFEELRIIDDPMEIPKILAKPTNEHGDVIEEFNPIPLPTDFQSYDVAPRDGYIKLTELVAVTGAVENVEAAFNASDANNDGVIDMDEFLHAPWSLSGHAYTDYYGPWDYDDVTSGDWDEPLHHNVQR